MPFLLIYYLNENLSRIILPYELGRPLSCDLPPPKFEDDFKHVVLFTIILFSCQEFFVLSLYSFF
jgi:hypothetical protein